MAQLSEIEYNKLKSQHLRELYTRYGEMRSDYSKDLITKEEFLDQCGLLLNEMSTAYIDIVFKQADSEH